MTTKPNEHGIRNAVARRLKRPEHRDLFAVKLHGGPYQRAGLPDFLFIFRRTDVVDNSATDGGERTTFVFVELKRDGGRESKLQRIIFARLRDLGAIIYVCRSADEVFDRLRECGYEPSD